VHSLLLWEQALHVELTPVFTPIEDQLAYHSFRLGGLTLDLASPTARASNGAPHHLLRLLLLQSSYRGSTAPVIRGPRPGAGQRGGNTEVMVVGGRSGL
jgi:hypothetical protein